MLTRCLLTLWLASLSTLALASDWTIPIGGNAYRLQPANPQGDPLRNGTLQWDTPEEVFAIYFHVDRPCQADFALQAKGEAHDSVLNVTVDQQPPRSITCQGPGPTYSLGNWKIDQPGYVRLTLQGQQRLGKTYLPIEALQITSSTPDLKIEFVRDNKDGMFYWGRRGPSVHLTYLTPKDKPLTYAYSELTVPAGQDVIGSYFMANGFGEGYFGIQVNSPTERRVLFSVWSPFQTDDPKSIPQEQRIVALGKGQGVHLGEFGNEGSGGQSYLVYPWKADTTYRFLTEVQPDGQGNTTYTSWFGPKDEPTWNLIASFRRPQTDTHLRGFHSFLENFDPTRGHLVRRALYGNIWVRDLDANWHPCLRAKFSVDATGGQRHRLDFAGGSQDSQFFLQNGGFFNENTSPGSTFERAPNPPEPPTFDLTSLPRLTP